MTSQILNAVKRNVCGPAGYNPKNSGTSLPETLAGYLQLREILLVQCIQCIIKLSTHVKYHNFTWTLYMIHAVIKVINLGFVLNKN